MTEQTYTAFAGEEMVCSGSIEAMLSQAKARFDQGDDALLLIFDDESGRQADFDLRGTTAEVLARVSPERPRVGPGRPKLGVVAREISLLPRHWEWLEQEPGGASATIRRLVDEEKKRNPGAQRARLAMAAADRFMLAMAGNRAGYEEATRALYAADRERFAQLIREWPQDIRTHALHLAEDAFQAN